MQVNRFFNGGYVIHKITGYWKGRVSAWFDASGQIVDAEQIPQPFGPTRPVKRGGPMWQEVARVGRRYMHNPLP